MKYTNKQNLPPAMVEALTHDEYSPGLGNYTPSSLNTPVYMKKLRDMHEDNLTIDAVDNFHLMMGSAVHKVLETTEAKSWKEVRVYCQVGEFLISAQLDHFWLESGILQDYKNTTVYKFTKDFNGNLPEVPEWESQLNIINYIMTHSPMIEQDGKLVPFECPAPKGLEIVGLLKDWSKAKARRDSKFPQTPIYRRPIRFWMPGEVEQYIIDRSRQHDEAKTKSIQELTPCSDEETWARPTVYAVMKTRTAKRSTKNCTTLSQAETEVQKYPEGWVDVRPGERPRCSDYCAISQNNLCPFFKEWSKK